MLTLLAIYAGCMSLPEIAKSGAKVSENQVNSKSLTKKIMLLTSFCPTISFFFCGIGKIV